MAQKGILDRISLPTRVVVNRCSLGSGALAAILRDGAWEPESGDTCELEAGGQVVARGVLVRRRGRWCFKATEVAKGGKA